MFPYKWNLSTANFTKDKGKVFSCFACGGGSTMGAKLAGFDVLGCNEIDNKMIETYKVNHNPKYAYLEPIQTFKSRKDLPKSLYKLDVLEGSPPCSSFSFGGNRDRDWSKEKKFAEGQAEQVLDTLFFDFIDLAKELQPKVVITENVKAMLQGKAIKYVTKVYQDLEAAGYYVGHYLLDTSTMGVPQKRERVFIIGIRKDIAKPFIKKDGIFGYKLKLDLTFNEPEIAIKKFYTTKQKTPEQNYLVKRHGDRVVKLHKPLSTVTTVNRYWVDNNTLLDDETLIKASTFPQDYVYPYNNRQYMVAMSVPPVAMAQIYVKIYEQILSKIVD